MKLEVSVTFSLLCSIALGKVHAPLSRRPRIIQENEYDRYFPYPDRINHFAVEVYHDLEEINLVLPQIDLGTMSTVSTKNFDFECFLESKTNLEEVELDAEVPKKDLLSFDDTEPSPEALLAVGIKSALKGKCFLKVIGYWTYKFCPFEQVEQIHYEYVYKEKVKTKRPTSIISLGTYSKDLSSNSVQVYEHGDGGRKTVVHFGCPESQSKQIDKIKKITEDKPLNYEISFQTLALCKEAQERYLDQSIEQIIESERKLSDDEVELEVRRILRLIDAQCYNHYKGWWNYEVCITGKIRQYHPGKNDKNGEFSLGEVVVEKGLPNVSIRHEPKYGRKVVTQLYSGGTECDLTGKKRQSELIFQCMDTVGFVEVISVDESVSCGYEIQVSLPLLCNLPGFSGKHSEYQKVDVQKTICFPEGSVDLVER